MEIRAQMSVVVPVRLEGSRKFRTEAAYRLLKDKIIRLELPPGQRIVEDEVALSLGMSRTPLREALVRLEEDGLVETLPRQGVRVSLLSKRDIREINRVLACLEEEAAKTLAVRRPGPDEMAQIDAAIAAMDEALEREEIAAWADADYRFHRLLIEMCGNRQLAAVAINFLEKAHRFRIMTLPLRSRPVYSNVNHAAVVEAIRRGDAETAMEIHRNHKARWTRELNELIDRLPVSE
jgi:DNA-binding GntR family transcriptional regulator